jgi:hypothetical protein
MDEANVVMPHFAVIDLATISLFARDGIDFYSFVASVEFLSSQMAEVMKKLSYLINHPVVDAPPQDALPDYRCHQRPMQMLIGRIRLTSSAVEVRRRHLERRIFGYPSTWISNSTGSRTDRVR